jgi:hypothetical protein
MVVASVLILEQQETGFPARIKEKQGDLTLAEAQFYQNTFRKVTI